MDKHVLIGMNRKDLFKAAAIVGVGFTLGKKAVQFAEYAILLAAAKKAMDKEDAKEKTAKAGENNDTDEFEDPAASEVKDDYLD